MSAAVTVSRATSADAIDSVIAKGDLSKLTADERVAYYRNVCDSIGLNPMTQPFAYIELQGKLTLYCRKEASDQLRQIHGVSLAIVSTKTVNDIYIVTARAVDKTGRTDESTGAVSIAGLNGDKLANAIMKCETKAKRRVTLSLCGLGWLDESETETIPGARVERVDPETGEVLQLRAAPVRNEAEESAALRDKAFAALEKAQHEREQLDKWHARVQLYKERGELTVDDTSALLNAYAMALSVLNASEA